MMMTGRRPQMAVTGLLLLLMMMMMTTVMMTGVRADDPLFLHHVMNEAKQMSEVSSNFTGNVKSYSGFFTVQIKVNVISHLFFWFFPSQNASAPLVLWLNGGRGQSSIAYALLENGPLELTMDSNGQPTLRQREIHWASHFHMLYIDAPAGVGYSFSNDLRGRQWNYIDNTNALYGSLVQFYRVFAEYQTNDLYIAGESHAGLYIPKLAQLIYNNRDYQGHYAPLPLKGIVLGHAWCDPLTMFPEFPKALYYAGLITKDHRRHYTLQIGVWINRTLSQGFVRYWDRVRIYRGIERGNSSDDAVRFLNWGKSGDEIRMVHTFMQRPETRQALHAGSVGTSGVYTFVNKTVFGRMSRLDMFNGSVDEMAFLMDKYKVLLYSAVMNREVTASMTEAFLQKLQWSGQDWYRNHSRQSWWNRNQTGVFGWQASYGNFTRVVVRNYKEQPEALLDMMVNFIYNLAFPERPPPPVIYS